MSNNVKELEEVRVKIFPTVWRGAEVLREAEWCAVGDKGCCYIRRGTKRELLEAIDRINKKIQGSQTDTRPILVY